MAKKKTRRTKDFKFKVALEAIKGDKQISEIASEYNVHPQQVSEWKKKLLNNGQELFSTQSDKDLKLMKKHNETLYKRIGQLSVESDFLKKKLGYSTLPGESQ